MKVDVEAGDNWFNLKISGELTFSDTISFAPVLEEVKKLSQGRCNVQLNNLTHVDSSGLRMLLLIHDACHESHSDLAFVGANGQVKEILIHSRFDTIVRMAD